MLGDPATESEYDTEQEPDDRSVHCPLEGVKVPVPLDEVNVTVPEGESPVTVAVHVVEESTAT